MLETLAHLKSYGYKPGALDVIEANGVAVVKSLKGGIPSRESSSKKVTWPTVQLLAWATNRSWKPLLCCWKAMTWLLSQELCEMNHLTGVWLCSEGIGKEGVVKALPSTSGDG